MLSVHICSDHWRYDDIQLWILVPLDKPILFIEKVVNCVLNDYRRRFACLRLYLCFTKSDVKQIAMPFVVEIEKDNRMIQVRPGLKANVLRLRLAKCKKAYLTSSSCNVCPARLSIRVGPGVGQSLMAIVDGSVILSSFAICPQCNKKRLGQLLNMRLSMNIAQESYPHLVSKDNEVVAWVHLDTVSSLFAPHSNKLQVKGSS